MMALLLAFHPPNLHLQRSKLTFKSPATSTSTSPPPFLSLLHRFSTMQELQQIHAQMLKTSAIEDPRCFAELLSFCALSDSGELSYAMRLFSSLPNPTSFHWNTLIHGYSLSPVPEQCLFLFIELLEQNPFLINPHTFPPVLKACAKISGISEGIQIHSWVIKCGAIADPYVGNTLIQMYFGCGRSNDGQFLFDHMPERNAVSWNCVIAGYSELGMWDKVKSLFWMMVRDAIVVPNSVSLIRMVTACTKSKDFASGKMLVEYIEERSFPICLNLGNALLNMYAKVGEMKEAQRLFQQMAEQDVVSWTTLVSGYASIGELELAHGIFDKIPTRNIITWNAMIAGYAMNGSFREAILLFREMMVLHVTPDKATLVSVLSACAKYGDLLTGEVLHGYIFKTGTEVVLDLLHSLIGLYTKCGVMSSAELLFRKMAVRNEISWTLMMEGYVKSGSKDLALEIFKQMPHKDVASWNALITALAQCNYCSDGLDIFKEMLRMKITPNCLTLVGACACARGGALEQGKWIHAYIRKNSIELDSQLSSSLIDMYAKCGCIELSLEVFNGMPRKDLLAWSTIIGGLAMHGHSTLALKFFELMTEAGLHPDAITFIGVLSACSHAGLVEEGWHYFNLMTEVYGISPTIEHCSCMVDLLGRCGFLKEAKDLIDGVDVSSNGVPIWGALLGACNLHENVELAEYATTRIVELDPKNSGGYVLLSNVYAKASKWDNVGKVRSAMKEKGIEKVPGCSSIEVDGIVHEFFAGDSSNPQCKEIYAMLNRLDSLLEIA